MRTIRQKPPTSSQRLRQGIAKSKKSLAVNDKGFVAASAINLVFGIIMALLALRFVLRLLGANPLNGFASFVYNLSQPLVAPFFGLFNYQAELSTARFEMATLIALIVYGVIAAILSRVLFADRHHV